MGVYIKGMEMPKSCSDCPMLDWDLDYIKCKVTGRHFKVKEEPFGARRVDDCPLAHVPPHGRLIDADTLSEHKFVCIPHVSVDGKEAGSAYRLGWNTAIEAVMENAETIIGGE